MRIIPTPIAGVMLVEIEPLRDERGFFARTFCAEAFAARGMASAFPHCNVSWNPRAGTLRGLHYQSMPRPEAKLVRATRGRVFDVAVDLRPSSPTFRRWTSVELDAESRNAIFIPEGCAHGFMTLEDDCEIFYQMSEVYVPELARCVHWSDPAIGIRWPSAPVVVGERDNAASCIGPAAGNLAGE